MNQVNRRNFLRLAGAGAAAAAAAPVAQAMGAATATAASVVNPENADRETQQDKPDTNIADAAKIARGPNSMPGLYPGRVVMVKNSRSVRDNLIVEQEVYDMIARSMLELTGEKKLKKAWRKFVKPGERIGLKVNPVAGKSLSTSHEVVRAVIAQLEESGIKRSQLTIWDRREFELTDVGFTQENYPGIRITGTEQMDKEGLYYGKDGKLYGEHMIDRDWYYWADVEGEYDEYTMPYMVNGGKYSYFTKIVTQELDRIINIPILKNAGMTVTLALKNLAFGSVSNTGRLHAKLWNETCAQVCAFAPLRDKVVLNIVDGIKGCFNGGPGANPQFFCDYHTIITGSDPVAVDRIGFDVVIARRIAEGLQKAPTPQGLEFMLQAEKLSLGVADREKIELREVILG
ncbi:MAG TPA: DUF362 domain-containing protein [Bacteroidales bacterium]|jgi:uncharacterized protein (DUF362 family)|nr:DUF362 domain-containing protein [Bacteroidota bacterium]HOH15702.1 DUF362 domain-containing protein [Bacteroidales bacterium]HOR10340.1 DUF362 domain-containing protein [Bacteroidales bacterium]HOT18033.1 DUF362 domain-containing protein [Bacteroidales bacterium]HPA68470.1 DUF362 domain-containing protein [Bacteroidales bacterium]